MLFSPVFAKPHPRRFVFPSSRDLCVLSVSALDCSFSFVASNLQFSTEDPDSVGTFNFQPSPCTKSFSCNAYASPRKRWALLTSSAQFSLRGVDKQRLTVFSDRAGGSMAEVGLLPFARVALQVATLVLPPYRTRFSKHQFTQPQLLAVLCLMRFEDWTFREAEVRLREHQELRAVLQLPAVPDYTTLYRFLRRLEDDTVDRGLQETVRRLRRRRSRPVSAAIDGTGLSDTSGSTFFHRRLE